ncbi:MAG TPA: TylF/MycF/NovP-related O-methyltransferase [Gammaproteobacteria bacterium]|nr:TylF/MycF/NovP-related O-methyltransferase [Gammaproteobacteria bacterium]
MLKNENSADVFYEQGMENSADISYEKNMENSADFFYKQGMLERANKNNDMAFKYFARAIALNRCEPASKELKKMASECFQAAIRASDTNEIKRLLVRACEMDSANEKMKNYAKKIFNDDVPDLTKKCFIFYDGDRAQQIHGEAYKRALEFVTLGGIVGDVLEFGVLGGWSARIFCETMRELNNFSNIHLFDSFEGLPEYASQVDLTSYEIGGRKIWQDKMRFPDSFLSQFGEPHEKHIHKKLSEIIRTERIIIHKGFYSDIFKKNLTLKASIVHIDCDLYQSTCEVLWGLYKMEALQDGCVLLFDDWNCNKANPNYGERRAFKEFLKDQRQFTASNWYSYGYNGMAFILHDVGT